MLQADWIFVMIYAAKPHKSRQLCFAKTIQQLKLMLGRAFGQKSIKRREAAYAAA
jgi:hypothetical protein